MAGGVRPGKPWRSEDLAEVHRGRGSPGRPIWWDRPCRVPRKPEVLMTVAWTDALLVTGLPRPRVESRIRTIMAIADSKRSYAAAHFALELNGESNGMIKSIEGGGLKVDVMTY